jgi:Family of unknown function (DUF6298)/Putative collagen-binding domain of a collagenase
MSLMIRRYLLVTCFLLVLPGMILYAIIASRAQLSVDISSGAISTADPVRLSPLSAAAGPLRVDLANPRYFTDGSGKATYLTGSHTWANFQDAGQSDPPPAFDYTAYLNFLQANNHNFFRLWTWEQAEGAPWTSAGIWFTPLPYQRTGPGKALDGKPKFDLSKFNQAYFDRLRDRVIQAGQRGIYVSIMLFDGWSIEMKNSGPGNPWQGHPFNGGNNVNGVNGDLNHNGQGEETHTLQSPAITALQEAYVRKVIDTVDDLDNVLYEISNESPSDSQDWQYHMINYIKSYEATKPKQHPVGMTVEYPGGDNSELFASPADWISPNDAGVYMNNPPAADGSKVIIADTDHLWGTGGNRQWMWKSFTRGINPIFMDCYDAYYCEGDNPNDPAWVSLRKNMGYALSYANRMNLQAMTPHGELASTGFCLANPSANNAEYLVYQPDGGSFSVDLSGASGSLYVEWLNPNNGQIINAGNVSGGGSRNFSPPFKGDAVLYISNSQNVPTHVPTVPVPTMTPIPNLDHKIYLPGIVGLGY